MRVTSLLVALAGCTTVALSTPFKRWDPPTPGLSLSQNEQDIFDYSMQVQDWSWEPWLGWIQANDDKGHTSTRFTAWYIVGLLHRNKGDDVQRAITAIRNVISLQFTDPADNGTAWYWDYKVAADIPDPNDETFPPAIYTSYDPNWSFFVGSAFVQAISEFEHLLPTDVVESMVDSTYKAARHLMTRVGYDGDNLVTAYSNPAIGRALIVEWVGHRLNDQNLTDAGNQYAQDVYDLFTADGHNTLGEYNSPTYYGIDVLELLQWIRHAPPDSKLPGYGSYILKELWADIGEHYNFNLKNMVGPYDRVYHRNFLYDDSIVTIWFWMLLGRERAPVASLGLLGTQFDLRQGACMALLGQTLRSELNSSIVDRLTEPVGNQDRIILRGTRDSLDNDTTRINTAWMSENLMAGGQQVAEEYNRGNQFAPMIAHWKSGETSVPDRPYVSFFQLFPTASTINATVTPNRISISYPNTTQAGTDVFQFLIGDIPGPYYSSGQMMKGFDNLPCLDVAVTSQGLNGTVKLGKYLDLNIQSNNFWTVNYYVNSTYEGTPSIDMDLKYTC